MKELGLFVFEGVADELQCPACEEKRQRINPQPVNEDASHEQRQRNQNYRYPQRVADPVYRMLMAARVLRDPLFVSAAASMAI